jgi:methylated-DNA-protein-cysteine methyltransferase-like protein
MSEFSEKVIEQISKIPKTKVATYKQIAELSGKPHASRAVSWILNSCSRSHGLPWHRVINSKGKIAFEFRSKNYRRQKKLLISEKVIVSENGLSNLDKYQWKKISKSKKNGGKAPKMFR